MKDYQTIKLDLIQNSILEITLNRPEVRNAFNEVVINELTEVFQQEVDQAKISTVILKGNGKSFSAGADLNWMKRSVDFTKEENIQDAKTLSILLSAIKNCKKPVIGIVHGASLGGGMGLTSTCDYVIAEKNTWFGFTEVKLGLIPAVISPFVVEKIGLSWTKSLFLTGKRFQSELAFQIGLIHEIAENEEDLKSREEKLIKEFLANSPEAMMNSKQLIFDILGKDEKTQTEITSTWLAQARSSRDAKIGINAFFNKEKPNWKKDD
jgi:methylglutaconyl-CoA hydratase